MLERHSGERSSILLVRTKFNTAWEANLVKALR
jgi:hypothetical protein